MKKKETEKNYFHELSQNWIENTSTLWGNTFKMQDELMGNLPSMWKQYMNSFSSFNHWNKEDKSLCADDFRNNIATIWKDMYESNFQKFFNIPQLGIGRNYQEQASSAMNAANKSMIAFSHFMALLYIPVERAGAMVMDEFTKMMDKNEFPKDPKAIYDIWIKALERYFMEMLQSPEYINAMHSLIDTISDHKESKGKLINAILRQLQIPSNSEMDELYQDLYNLKKRLKGVEKQLKSMTKEVEISTPENDIKKAETNKFEISIPKKAASKKKQTTTPRSDKSTRAKPVRTAAKPAQVASPTKKNAQTSSKKAKATKQTKKNML
ncbi:poly(R)-hydroxyalkanoic acid synthase, class III, PhaE subunit [Desulfocicer vacuolatum DSM 3385]|uniref:Poly(3-hydroxyalkanoate) polymerase subunit PhaE n=1 Tax=Desulfocicer vacuolatum DSM 3385 TaxID=1121400 RepID=A0A1W2ELA0_9BACT|nr:poly(R)-hydroxyalkanoic acid synthase subunit PhaE [Desulfocicer vacuolatum]SMD10521.1 poly(R)-hydroxyalkanoic acid synthase, class III, PhaE subunit [Desulfocicer vacuolatum DSM 3385]